MVYSEAGGATKTASAVALAMMGAEAGLRTVLLDLDPRAAATRWIGVEPEERGLHIGAILADADPDGWVADLARPTVWHEKLWVVPSDRSLSNREADRVDHAELRLVLALRDVPFDLVVIDCPNRQGGVLTMSALAASDAVVYAASPTQDGVDGVEGARRSVRHWWRSREVMGAPSKLREAGIIVAGVESTILSRPTVTSIDTLRETGLLLTPLVPRRAIVGESRIVSRWYGDFTKGDPVVAAYRELFPQVVKKG